MPSTKTSPDNLVKMCGTSLPKEPIAEEIQTGNKKNVRLGGYQDTRIDQVSQSL